MTTKLSKLRVSLSYLMLCLCAASCADTGDSSGGLAFKEPIDYPLRALGSEISFAFADRLRAPYAISKQERGPYGSARDRIFTGNIPFARGTLEGIDYCDRTKNPKCMTFVFGDELQSDRDTAASMYQWFQDLCFNLPDNPTEYSPLYISAEVRRYQIKLAKEAVGCGATDKEEFKVYVEILPKLDDYIGSNLQLIPKAKTESKYLFIVSVKRS